MRMPPPNSQVTPNELGASHDSTLPLALPSRAYSPPSRRSPLTGRNQRGMRSTEVNASHTSSIGAR